MAAGKDRHLNPLMEGRWARKPFLSGTKSMSSVSIRFNDVAEPIRPIERVTSLSRLVEPDTRQLTILRDEIRSLRMLSDERESRLIDAQNSLADAREELSRKANRINELIYQLGGRDDQIRTLQRQIKNMLPIGAE